MRAQKSTPEGKRLLEKASPIALMVAAAVLKFLTVTERETFNNLL